MTRHLILGGAGFIGSHLAEALLQKGHHVRLFDRPNVERPPSLAKYQSLEWMPGDFQSTADVYSAVSGIDVIFHLVSTTLPKNSNDDPVFDVQSNLCGSLRLLAAAVENGVRKVIFISSGGTVYGIPHQVPIPETHPTEPLVSYGITKLAIEKYLKLHHELYGLDYTVLRVANPYGERQRTDTAQGAVAVFARKALSGEIIEIWGDGSVTRDYIYVSDVVKAFLCALEYTGETRVFNIGSGVGVSLNDLLEAIESLTGRQLERRYMAARKFDVPVSVLDITRAQVSLGWGPQITLRAGLERTLRWMSESMHDAPTGHSSSQR